MRSHAVPAGAAGLLALALAAPAAAGDWKTLDDTDWCRDHWSDFRRHHLCEVRETELPAGRDVIAVDAGPNGGVEVVGWDEDRIVLQARITVWGDDEEESEETAAEIRIDTGDEIRASGPRSRDGRGWSVDFRLRVPRRSDLALESLNGGLSVEDVAGTIDLDTTNGGIRLENVGGEVTGHTTNGGISVALEGKTWEGEGLDLESSNGGIHVEIPRDYSALLMAGTDNGGIRSDFRVERERRHGGVVRATLGEGGPLLRVMTRNGGVRIEES
jgi:hypothetical protein